MRSVECNSPWEALRERIRANPQAHQGQVENVSLKNNACVLNTYVCVRPTHGAPRNGTSSSTRNGASSSGIPSYAAKLSG